MSKTRGNATTDRYEPRRVIDTARRWYVLQTRRHADVKAAEELAKDGVDVWAPRHWTITVRRKRRVEVERLFFPGYVFAGLRRDNFGLFYHCEHVTAVLGTPDPLAIPPAVVQAVADELTGNVRSERLQAAALFRIGELRSVDRGPFTGFLARVTELLRNGRVKADVTVFGRATSLELDPSMLGAA